MRRPRAVALKARAAQDRSRLPYRVLRPGARFRLTDAPSAATNPDPDMAVCYGLCYGLGMERLAVGLSVSVSQARALRSQFLRSFPKLEHFQETIRKQARQHGRVMTLGGRGRLLPHIASSNGTERAKAERQAVNSVIQVRRRRACFCTGFGRACFCRRCHVHIPSTRMHASSMHASCGSHPAGRSLAQGSAADIVKEAMIRCSRELRLNRVPARLCAQIHDELLWEVA